MLQIAVLVDLVWSSVRELLDYAALSLDPIDSDVALKRSGV